MRVEVRDGRLLRDGQPWFPVGVNYHPSSAGVRWLRSWLPIEIEADLEAMARAGLDVVRVFTYWADLEPTPGQHDRDVLLRLERFAALADARGLAVVVSVPTVWMNGHRFLPPWLGSRDLWRDRVAVERAEAAVGAVAGAVGNSGAAALYDLGDESPHVDPQSFELSRQEVAVRHRWAAAVRAAHPGAPVFQAHDASEVFARHPSGPDDLAGLDLGGVHGSPLWGPRSIASHSSPLASRLVPFLVRYGRAHAPVLVDGIGTQLASPAVAADHLRATLPALAAAGAAGVVAGSWIDVTAAGAPFDERPSERTTGLVDDTGRPRPALTVVSGLAHDARHLWARAERPPAAVALFLPERSRTPERTNPQNAPPDGLALFHADVLCSRAHLPTEVTRTLEVHHRLVVSPAAGCVTERDIAALHAAAHRGATVLLTLGDPLKGFPGWGLTGVELVDFAPGRRHDRFSFEGAVYPLHWEQGQRAAVVDARGADVLARFGDGTPALTRQPLGQGHVWMLAAPLEAQLNDPDHIDAAPWHRLYRTIAESAGATARVPSCATPDVELQMLRLDSRRVLVAVNHGSRPVTACIQGDGWPAGETLDLAAKSAVALSAWGPGSPAHELSARVSLGGPTG